MQVSRDKLISLGSCLGKFTHSGKFRLTIGCLDILAAHAKYKVCARHSSILSSAMMDARAVFPTMHTMVGEACWQRCSRGAQPGDDQHHFSLQTE